MFQLAVEVNKCCQYAVCPVRQNTILQFSAKERSLERSVNFNNGGKVQVWGEKRDPGGGVEKNIQDIRQVKETIITKQLTLIFVCSGFCWFYSQPALW